MLTLPIIGDLARVRSSLRRGQRNPRATFIVTDALKSSDLESCLRYLATHLDIEILAAVRLSPSGNSAEMIAAGRSGLSCKLSIPSLEGRGIVSHLVAAARPAEGRAKIFSSEELFPGEGSWFDLVPMDSSVSYFFLPLDQVGGSRPVERREDREAAEFILAADHEQPPDEARLPLKAIASAALVQLRRASGADQGQGQSREEDAGRERMKLFGRFMSTVAHEIKNPLTGISAGVQYLSKRIESGACEQDTVDFILAEISRLSRIVDDLYKIAKPPELVLGPTRINDVVEKSLLCLSEAILTSRLSVRQDLDPEIPVFDADPDRLQQVIINIIKNAIEASPEGGSVEIRTGLDGASVVIAVGDTGPGIPDADRERILEPFYSTKEKGTGLGLSVSRAIVDAHGGTISAGTREEGGACFTIRLPIRG
jgi:signal transduction histidine kinase